MPVNPSDRLPKTLGDRRGFGLAEPGKDDGDLFATIRQICEAFDSAPTVDGAVKAAHRRAAQLQRLRSNTSKKKKAAPSKRKRP